MTVAQKPVVESASPRVAYFVNWGTQTSPYGEVYFNDPNASLVIGFKSGRVWAKRGGFGVKLAHYRVAYEYLVRAGVARYRKFARDRVGKVH